MATQKGEERLYDTLCRVLDSLRSEAPKSDSTYNPPAQNHDAVIQARSRALLHLFLKARFGLLVFDDRARYITDGPNDGGVDAYFIDKKNKNIFICQSKFRANAANFANAHITPADLLKMEVSRILKGEKLQENGQFYNDKIRNGLQKEIRRLTDVGSYSTQVVFLGNAKHLTPLQLKKLVDGYSVDQYPHSRIYDDLLFPVINGTYYNDPNLTIELSLANVKGGTHLNYDVKTAKLPLNVKLLFVPTSEVGRIMHTYKNSILKFNPRSFLELSRNLVNKEINKSLETTKGNEFALFNNGLTMIADSASISDDTARRNVAQIVIRNPQLVNGGQTAFTLARVYEQCERRNDFHIFKGKEVLLRVISFSGKPKPSALPKRLDLMGEVSKASNSQTKVEESDRRSNDHVQLKLQSEFFEKYGLYYERKRGEFSDGIHSGYIQGSQLINREKLIRIALCCEYRVSQAKSNISKFFTEDELAVLMKIKDVDKYVYGYELLGALDREKRLGSARGDRYQTKKVGQALRYGPYAVIAVCVNRARGKTSTEDLALDKTLAQWRDFEKWVLSQKDNGVYKRAGGFDFITYYKGGTVNQDLAKYKFKF